MSAKKRMLIIKEGTKITHAEGEPNKRNAFIVDSKDRIMALFMDGRLIMGCQLTKEAWEGTLEEQKRKKAFITKRLRIRNEVTPEHTDPV